MLKSPHWWRAWVLQDYWRYVLLVLKRGPRMANLPPCPLILMAWRLPRRWESLLREHQHGPVSYRLRSLERMILAVRRRTGEFVVFCFRCAGSTSETASWGPEKHLRITMIIIYLYKFAIIHHGMQSFRIIVNCTPAYWMLVYCTIVTPRIYPTYGALQLQYHYASMQMNAMAIDSMLRNELVLKTFDNYQ